MWDSGAGMGWWMVLGSVWFIIFGAILVWAVMKIAGRGDVREQPSALEIIRQRYARECHSRGQCHQYTSLSHSPSHAKQCRRTNREPSMAQPVYSGKQPSICCAVPADPHSRRKHNAMEHGLFGELHAHDWGMSGV